MEKINKALEELVKNNPNSSVRIQEILELRNGAHPVVTIYPLDKVAEFHGQYTQTAPLIREFESFIETLKKEEYRTNLI